MTVAASSPAVSVIIPTFNGRALLEECLASLAKQRFRHFETIVVDDGSSDGTDAWLRSEYPAVRIVSLGGNRGFPAACNAGIRAAASPLIALLNNDAVADEAWLKALVAAAESHPDIPSFASQIRMRSRPDAVESLGDSFSVFGWAGHEALGMPVSRVPRGVSEPFGACACAALYRRSALEHIGLFDERFFLSHEDVDLGFRLRLAGYRCLCVHDAVVWHRGLATRGAGNPRTLFLSRRNQWFVLAKNMPLALLVLLSPLILFGQLLSLHSRFITLRFGRAALVTVRARIAAARALSSFFADRRRIQSGRRLPVLALLRRLSWRA